MEIIREKLPNGYIVHIPKTIKIGDMDFYEQVTDEELKKCKNIPFYGTCENKTEDGRLLRPLTKSEECEIRRKEIRAMERQRTITDAMSWASIVISLICILINLL